MSSFASANQPLSPSAAARQQQEVAAARQAYVSQQLENPAVQDTLYAAFENNFPNGLNSKEDYDRGNPGFEAQSVSNLTHLFPEIAQNGVIPDLVALFKNDIQRVATEVIARRNAARGASNAAPSTAPASVNAIPLDAQSAAVQAAKDNFWVSRRIIRPGTIKPGTVSGLSKEDKSERYKNDLKILHKLTYNDFSHKLAKIVELDHAILRWGATFARHNVDKAGGKIEAPYRLTKSVKGVDGKRKTEEVSATLYFAITWEQYSEIVNHRDHIVRSIIDWLKSRRSFGNKGSAPLDYEFKLQNSIIYVNDTFRAWFQREHFGSYDGELRAGLLRASKGQDAAVNGDFGAAIRVGTNDQGATVMLNVDAAQVPPEGDAAYVSVMNNLGTPGSTLLAEGFTTVAAISLIRTAVKTATGEIWEIGRDGVNRRVSDPADHPVGLAGVAEALIKKNNELYKNSPDFVPFDLKRAKGVEKVLSASAAMRETFDSMPASRQYSQQYNKKGDALEGKHKSIPVPPGSTKTTFQALRDLYLADVFPREAAKFAAERLKAANNKRFRIAFVDANHFVNANINSILYLNGDLLSAFVEKTPEATDRMNQLLILSQQGGPASRPAQLLLQIIDNRARALADAADATKTPEEKFTVAQSDVLKVLLRESRYLRLFYSSHWRTEKDDTPNTIPRIYNSLVQEHAFDDLLLKHQVNADDIKL